MATVSNTPNIDENAPLTPIVFHILLAMADGNAHGYAIMKAVAEATGSSLRTGPGTIYGSLQRLEESGLVKQRGWAKRGRRRLYALTPLGRRSLKEEAARLDRLARLVKEKGLIPGEA